MNDDRMQEDDAPSRGDRGRNNGRRGAMEVPDDEPALDGYAR